MNKSPMPKVLLVILAASAIASVVLCWMYISASRELRQLQMQANLVNNNRAVVNSLVMESIEYSKKNAAILPILESAGIKPNAPAANK